MSEKYAEAAPPTCVPKGPPTLTPNDGGPMYRKGAGLVATNTVYADNRRPSALILPVVSR